MNPKILELSRSTVFAKIFISCVVPPAFNFATAGAAIDSSISLNDSASLIFSPIEANSIQRIISGRQAMSSSLVLCSRKLISSTAALGLPSEVKTI